MAKSSGGSNYGAYNRTEGNGGDGGGMSQEAGGAATVNLPGPTAKVPPVRGNSDIQGIKRLAQGKLEAKP